MPTVGRTTTSGNNNWVQNTGSMNQQAMRITMPEAGIITTLHVYVSGSGSTITGQLCLWNSSGTLVAQTGNITFSSGSTGINGQATQSHALSSNYLASSGQVLYIGWWRSSSQTANFSYINSGGTIRPQVLSGVSNVSSPTTLTVSTGTTGQLTAWADYTPAGGLGLAASGSFVKHPLNRWSGSAWQRHPLKRWNSSTGSWEWLA